MSPTAIAINGIAGVALGVALLRDRQRALRGLQVAARMTWSMLPMVIIIILLIGALFAVVSPDALERFVGDQSGPLGVVLVALVGGVLHIPALLAFPLSASLLNQGASVPVVAAFITSLTMIGVVTLPLEMQELGRRFALLRNGLSLLAALGISFIMGVVL
ncbi:MAG: permease [Alkalispirochaeta sp.]